MRFVLLVFLFSSLASLRVVFFFGLVSFCEMMLLMMIWWVNSLLAAFYYGNITYPSHDPPKMGFLLTVPQDAVRGPILLVQPGYVHPSHPPNDLLIARQDGKSLNRSRLRSCRLMIQPLRKDFRVSSRLTFARSTAFLQTSKLRPGQTVKASSHP